MKTNKLKAVLALTGVCLLAGLSNPAAAAYCRSERGYCQTQGVEPGHDNRLWFHATAEGRHGRPAHARVQIVEADHGRVVYAQRFQKETDNMVRVSRNHKDDKYKCNVRATNQGPWSRTTVSCRIR